MKLHNVEISPRGVRIDGLSVVVEMSGPRVEELGPDLHVVHVPVIAQTVTINGDTHDPDAGTPIYDQLKAEMEGTA